MPEWHQCRQNNQLNALPSFDSFVTTIFQMYLFDCSESATSDVIQQVECCAIDARGSTVRRLFVITASNTGYSIRMVTVPYNIRLDFCHLNITMTSQFKHRFALNCFCRQLPEERFMVNRSPQTRTTIPFGFISVRFV